MATAQPSPQRIREVESGMIQRRREGLRIPGDIHEPYLQRRDDGQTGSNKQQGDGRRPRFARR
jgi:hypothetical protein